MTLNGPSFVKARAFAPLALLLGVCAPVTLSAECTEAETQRLLQRLENISSEVEIDGTYRAAARIASGDLAGGITGFEAASGSDGKVSQDAADKLAVFLYQSRFIGNEQTTDRASASRRRVSGWDFAKKDLAQSLKIARTQIKTTGGFKRSDALIQNISDADLSSATYWDAIIALAGAGRADMVENLQKNAPRTVADLTPFLEKAGLGVAMATRAIADGEPDLVQKFSAISDPDVAGWASIYGVESLSLSDRPRDAYALVSVPPKALHRAVAMIQYLEHFGDRTPASDQQAMLDWARSNLAEESDHLTVIRLAHAYLRAGFEASARDIARDQLAVLGIDDPYRPTYLAIRGAAESCIVPGADFEGMPQGMVAETIARTILLGRQNFEAERALPQAAVPVAAATTEPEPSTDPKPEPGAKGNKEPQRSITEIREQLHSCAKNVTQTCLVQVSRDLIDVEGATQIQLIQLAWIEAASGDIRAAEATLKRAFADDIPKAYVAAASIIARTGHIGIAKDYLDGFSQFSDMFLSSKYEAWLGPLFIALAKDEISQGRQAGGDQTRAALRYLARLDRPGSKQLLSALSEATKFNALNMAWEENADDLVRRIFQVVSTTPEIDYARAVARIRSLEITADSGPDVLNTLMEFNKTLPEDAAGKLVFLSRAVTIGNFQTAMEIFRNESSTFRLVGGKWIVTDEEAPEAIRQEALNIMKEDLEDLPEGMSKGADALWFAIQDYKAAASQEDKTAILEDLPKLLETALTEADTLQKRNGVLLGLIDAGLYDLALIRSSTGPEENMRFQIYAVLQNMRGL